MTELKSHLVKYHSPTKWDKAPYATIWRATTDGDDAICIQMSKDIENPNWVPLPDVLVKAFNRFYTDPCFIQECINMYEAQQKQVHDGIDYIDFVKQAFDE